MDVCRPPTVWLGGSCYRKNPYLESKDGESYTDSQDKYQDDQVAYEDEQNGPDDAGFCPDIKELANGRFKASLHVANAYHALIIGKKGMIKQRIERETKTQIQVPKIGSEDTQDIMITGNTRTGVLSACNRINVIAQSARSKQSFTHFISIPLNAKQLQDTFLQFKEAVLSECLDCRGLDPSIFQTPSLLHLTLCTLPLMDSVERGQAIEVLEDCKEHVILPLLGEEPLEVEVQGLEIMNDDQAEVDVLYAKVRPSGDYEEDLLQMTCDQIVDKFVEAGLAPRQYERVKLHLTLINSLFRKEEIGIAENENSGLRQKQDGTKRETFDARPIFAKFGNFNFGKIKITEVHLSQRRSGKRGPGNYYYPSMVIQLNSCG